MNSSDAELKLKFRSVLPESHNREMWVNETYLEYKRFIDLKDRGFSVRPIDGSLLSIFISLITDSILNNEASNNFDLYEDVYGQPVDYCWNRSLVDLVPRSAAAANQPATAWMTVRYHGAE